MDSITEMFTKQILKSEIVMLDHFLEVDTSANLKSIILKSKSSLYKEIESMISDLPSQETEIRDKLIGMRDYLDKTEEDLAKRYGGFISEKDKQENKYRFMLYSIADKKMIEFIGNTLIPILSKEFKRTQKESE